MVSLPAPPSSVSLPARPISVSLPSKAWISAPSSREVMLSARPEPKISFSRGSTI
jgi:hypothetical protein